MIPAKHCAKEETTFFCACTEKTLFLEWHRARSAKRDEAERIELAVRREAGNRACSAKRDKNQ